NNLLWHFPTKSNVNLFDIEFKAIPSGGHLVKTDTVYFTTKEGYFGVSAFENLATNSNERGAKIFSVGLVSASYSSLHFHLTFLREQAARYVNESEGNFQILNQSLTDYYTNFKPKPTFTLIESVGIQELKYAHPLQNFNVFEFLEFFGSNIFVFWKYSLLKKRILFFSDPPVEVGCLNVFISIILSSMGNLSKHLPNINSITNQVNPLFFVNVNNIATIKEQNSFIAFTSEKIFQVKESLWDIFLLYNQIIFNSQAEFRYTCNPTDEERFKKLEAHLYENTVEEPLNSKRNSISSSSNLIINKSNIFKLRNKDFKKKNKKKPEANFQNISSTWLKGLISKNFKNGHYLDKAMLEELEEENLQKTALIQQNAQSSSSSSIDNFSNIASNFFNTSFNEELENGISLIEY
ncbi:hypothetical protein HK099_006963, partial [Clydaea vesicula]